MARFQPSIGYQGTRRPRGPGRGRYHMSPDAVHARRENLKAALASGALRRRCGDESRTMKLLVSQTHHDPEPRPTQRALARQLGVSQPYVCKVQKRAASEGMDAL